MIRVFILDKSAILFHGTTKVNANNICNSGFKSIYMPDIGRINTHNVSKNPGSLGYGLYGFLEEKGELALAFSQKFNKDDAEVVRFTIRYSEDYCVNFLNSTDAYFFNEWVNDDKRKKSLLRLREKYRNSGSQKSLDGAIIEYYLYDMKKRHLLNKVQVVTMLTHTVVGNEVLAHSAIPNGVEFCVKSLDLVDNNSIKKI